MVAVCTHVDILLFLSILWETRQKCIRNKHPVYVDEKIVVAAELIKRFADWTGLKDTDYIEHF